MQLTPLEDDRKMKSAKSSLTGFTLIELLVVIIIIGVLATLGLTHYGGMREQTIDREAKANLSLIQAAQKIYHMEADSFYASTVDCDTVRNSLTGIEGINDCLKLALPAAAGHNWDYSTTNTGSGIATRTSGTKVWTLLIDADDATCAGTDCR